MIKSLWLEYEAQEARETVVVHADPNIVKQYNEFVAKYKEAEVAPPVLTSSGGGNSDTFVAATALQMQQN